MRYTGDPRPRRKDAGGRDLERLLVRDEVFRAGDPTILDILYAFSFPSHPRLLKIGYSSRGADADGAPRVAAQTTGYPEKPILRMLIHAENARDLEMMVHAGLHHQRRRGTGGREWFEATLAEVLEACPEIRELVAREDLRLRLSRRRDAAGIVEAWHGAIQGSLREIAARNWRAAVLGELARQQALRPQSWRVSVFGPRGPGSWRDNLVEARRSVQSFGVKPYNPQDYIDRVPEPTLDRLPTLSFEFTTEEERRIELRLQEALVGIIKPRLALLADQAAIGRLPSVVAIARQDQGKVEDQAAARAATLETAAKWVDDLVAATLPQARERRRELFGLDEKVLRTCADCDALMRLPVDRSGEATCPTCGVVRTHRT
jgi:hypothetical protein